MFAGRDSLRVRGERKRFVLTLLFLPLTLGLVGYFLQNTLSIHNLLLIVVGAMLFVALQRGRFLGGGVRIGPDQFAHVHAIAEECARIVGVPTPHVFVRDDPFVPIVAVGTGEPYALVFSSQYIEAFGSEELRFLIGRELGHIAAGHTRLTSLLSANGRENVVIAIAFGAWLRWIEYTGDRVGLLCCGSLQAAFSAIAVSTFHHVGRKIDLHTFAEQRRELDAEPMLRIGEWIGGTPYATNRIARLATFARDPLYQHWAQLVEERTRTAMPDALPVDDPRRFAGPVRRALAFCIDYVVVSALVPEAHGSSSHVVSPESAHVLTTDPTTPALVKYVVTGFTNGDWTVALNQSATWAILAAYVVLLVAAAGQTFGMMICDLRVIGERRQQIGLGGTIARYACFLVSLPLFVGVFGLLRRIQPFEKWSRTRLVNGSAVRA